MALLLCSGFSKAIEGCCSCLDKSCGACKGSCDKCSKALGDNCGFCCQCLNGGCDSIETALKKPFSWYTIFALGMNLVCFGLVTYYALNHFDAKCSGGPVSIWAVVCVIFYLLNVAFAILLCSKFSGFTQQEFSDKRAEFEAQWQFLMYDPLVLVYIIVVFLEFIWACIGFSWVGSSTAGGDCPEALLEISTIGAALLMVFICCGFNCLVCSLFWSRLPSLFYDECKFLQCVCCCLVPCVEKDEPGAPMQKGQAVTAVASAQPYVAPAQVAAGTPQVAQAAYPQAAYPDATAPPMYTDGPMAVAKAAPAQPAHVAVQVAQQANPAPAPAAGGNTNQGLSAQGMQSTANNIASKASGMFSKPFG